MNHSVRRILPIATCLIVAVFLIPEFTSVEAGGCCDGWPRALF